MSPGQLDKRVSIQAIDDTSPKSASGQPQKVWVTEATRWARIKTAQGRELYRGQQVGASLTHEVTMRYYEGLTTAHRLLYGSRVFDINFIENQNERGEWHVLLCKESA